MLYYSVGQNVTEYIERIQNKDGCKGGIVALGGGRDTTPKEMPAPTGSQQGVTVMQVVTFIIIQKKTVYSLANIV